MSGGTWEGNGISYPEVSGVGGGGCKREQGPWDPEFPSSSSAPFPGLRGVGPGCNTREIADKLIELKAEIEELQQREQELDQHKVWVQQSIRNVTEDVQNSRYPPGSPCSRGVGEGPSSQLGLLCGAPGSILLGRMVL